MAELGRAGHDPEVVSRPSSIGEGGMRLMGWGGILCKKWGQERLTTHAHKHTTHTYTSHTYHAHMHTYSTKEEGKREREGERDNILKGELSTNFWAAPWVVVMLIDSHKRVHPGSSVFTATVCSGSRTIYHSAYWSSMHIVPSAYSAWLQPPGSLSC